MKCKTEALALVHTAAPGECVNDHVKICCCKRITGEAAELIKEATLSFLYIGRVHLKNLFCFKSVWLYSLEHKKGGMPIKNLILLSLYEQKSHSFRVNNDRWFIFRRAVPLSQVFFLLL